MKTVAAIVVTYLPEKDHFRKLLSALKGQVQKIIIVDNSPADHVDHEMGGDIILFQIRIILDWRLPKIKASNELCRMGQLT